MSLRIDRKNDKRAVKAILHRTADIPGGVTVRTARLGGSALFEGTPLAMGENGLYEVVKTAQIVEEAAANATSYSVAKGHHFKVGDRFAVADCNGQTITTINTSDAAKDVITVSATLGKVVAENSCAFESAGANTNLKFTPIAVAGSNYDVVQNDNLFVDAWAIAVVRKGNAPIVNAAIEAALKCVVYV